MTTMRSVEPMTGLDAMLARLVPFLNGTEPQPGERGVDRHGNLYVRTPAGTWSLARLREPEPDPEMEIS
jgi:hypothetical protein